ncbi:MAG: hypothetical protein KGO49_03695, partial [Gammaproteobacteria bacterium]|nr:hypothetical protein [Gammaproteobacteria bacterium]
MSQLRVLFSADIASRIISSTVLTRDIGQYQFARREEEILDWLKEHDRESEQWIAVDDAIWQFAPPRHRLIACQGEVGFDAEIAKQLRRQLELNAVIEFAPSQNYF